MSFATFLAVRPAGGLIDLTHNMRDETVKAPRNGLARLKQLNSTPLGRAAFSVFWG